MGKHNNILKIIIKIKKCIYIYDIKIYNSQIKEATNKYNLNLHI